MTFFGLKYGQDLENWAAHPHQEFPGVPPGQIVLVMDVASARSDLVRRIFEIAFKEAVIFIKPITGPYLLWNLRNYL